MSRFGIVQPGQKGEAVEEQGKLAIITDGSLPEDTRAAVNKVVPFFVIADGKEFQGDALSVEEFLELQRISHRPPSTSMVRETDFINAFKSLYDEGYRRFVVLTVPENKSGTFNQAEKAAEKFRRAYPRTEFLVFDSGTTAGGVEFMVNEVNLMRESSLADIEGVLARLREQIELFLALDTVAYIGASGRVEELSRFKLKDTLQRYARGLAAWFAARTHHSPKVLITFNQGKEKIAGFGRFYPGMIDKIVVEIRERSTSGRVLTEIVIYYSESAEGASNLAKRLGNLVSSEIYIRADISIALRSITGPKFVAVFCRYST